MAQQDPHSVDPPIDPAAQREELGTRLAAILGGASPDTVRALVQHARYRSVPAGELIYRQGEPARLTLILTGYMYAQRTTEDGHTFLSGVGGAGLLFGYSAVAGTASSVDMVALADCRVAQWPGREVRSMLQRDPAFATLAIDSLSGSLHAVIEQIDGYLHQDARRRVLRILAKYRDLFFGEPPVLTRRHLPGLVGTTREMTRRVLRQLEREGTLVRVGPTGMNLLRPERLGDAAPAREETRGPLPQAEHVSLQTTRPNGS